MSKEEKEKLVKEIKEMSVEEQYADIYIEAELHTPRRIMAINTEIEEAKYIARQEGLEEGQEEGRIEGHIQGHAEGLEEGRAEGRAEAKIETAKNMISKNMDINLISELTGLTIEEINLLK